MGRGAAPPEIPSREIRLEAGAEIAKVAQEVKNPMGEVDQPGAEFDALAEESQHRRDQAEQGCMFEK